MMMQKFNQQLRDWFVSRHLKATFAVTVANPNIRAGTQSLLQIAGLGKLRPNIILMGYKQNWAQRQSAEAMAEMNDYFGLIQSHGGNIHLEENNYQLLQRCFRFEYECGSLAEFEQRIGYF